MYHFLKMQIINHLNYDLIFAAATVHLLKFSK